MDLVAILVGAAGLLMALPRAYGSATHGLHPALVVATLDSSMLPSERGLTAHDTAVACLDVDDPSEVLDGRRWPGPASLEVRSSSGRTWDVTVDARTGPPG